MLGSIEEEHGYSREEEDHSVGRDRELHTRVAVLPITDAYLGMVLAAVVGASSLDLLARDRGSAGPDDGNRVVLFCRTGMGVKRCVIYISNLA